MLLDLFDQFFVKFRAFRLKEIQPAPWWAVNRFNCTSGTNFFKSTFLVQIMTIPSLILSSALMTHHLLSDIWARPPAMLI